MKNQSLREGGSSGLCRRLCNCRSCIASAAAAAASTACIGGGDSGGGNGCEGEIGDSGGSCDKGGDKGSADEGGSCDESGVGEGGNCNKDGDDKGGADEGHSCDESGHDEGVARGAGEGPPGDSSSLLGEGKDGGNEGGIRASPVPGGRGRQGEW